MKSMSKIRTILVALFLIVLNGAVFAGGQKEKEESSTLKIAALLPGPINDGGWNTLMYSSLKHQEEVFGAEIAYSERTPASDYEEIFRGYAESGYDVIFGHGFEFGEPASKLAKDYPDVTFIMNSTSISQGPNLGSFLVNDFESGFAQGAIAAIVSKSGVVGYVGGMEIPPITNQAAGFVAGAKYANPGIQVSAILTGSFDDIAKAKEVALSMIAGGADILVGDADEASHGVFEAAEEHHVYVIGCATDIYETAPDYRDIILASVPEDMPKGHELMIQAVLDGTFEAKNYSAGFQTGVVTVTSFRDKDSVLSADQKSAIKKIIDDLKAGAIDLEKLK